jgi:hypothetical protein
LSDGTKNALAKKSSLSLPRRSGHRPSLVDFQRFGLAEAGMTIADIAIRQGVSERTVEQSIERVRMWRTLHSLDMLVTAETEMINELRPQRRELFRRGLLDPDSIERPEVQLRTQDQINELIATLMRIKAGPAMQQNVQVNMAVAEGGLNERSYEARLRRILARRAEPEEHARVGDHETGSGSSGDR